ncbi:MAG: hypothetical protein K6G42_03865 [Lachnospiraceae bacterium]|nr:hypothetical protein [Lachnospiraceae bacterium]
MDRKLSDPLRLIISAVALLAAATILLTLLWFRGVFLPDWIEWNRECVKTIPEDLKDKLSADWLLQDALSFDIDGDGKEDRVLLVWKRGSYGERRPTWVRRDEIGFSQHIFIYSERKDGWYPIWMSSGLDFEVASFSIGDHILGTERKSLELKAPNGETSLWGWLEWGLERVG